MGGHRPGAASDGCASRDGGGHPGRAGGRGERAGEGPGACSHRVDVSAGHEAGRADPARRRRRRRQRARDSAARPGLQRPGHGDRRHRFRRRLEQRELPVGRQAGGGRDRAGGPGCDVAPRGGPRRGQAAHAGHARLRGAGDGARPRLAHGGSCGIRLDSAEHHGHAGRRGDARRLRARGPAVHHRQRRGERPRGDAEGRRAALALLASQWTTC